MSVKNYKTPTGWRPQTLQHKKDKDPVDVICRIKPLDQDSGEQCITVLNSRTVKLMPPPTSYTFRNSGKEQYYKFQHVFSPEASQKHLFDQVAKPLVADLLQGKNSLLFAYGVTGSGKTYTMQGTPEDCGVLQRTLDVIFNSIQDYQAERCVFVPDCMNGFDVQTEDEAAESRKALNTQMNVNKTPRTQRQRIVSTPAQDIPHRIPDGSRVHTLIEDNKYAVFVTYIEIYQNYIYDLLEQLPTTSSSSRGFQTKLLREDASHSMYVHGCTEVEVTTPEEALEVMVKGQRRRKVATTHINFESSRSHSIFSVRVVQIPLDAFGEEVVQDKASITVSQLLLVDLAGSERNSRTGASGGRIKEAGNINNSLMTLRACIEALRENQKSSGCRMVPYRDSKLTHYLKNYFDGEGKIKMIVCVNPNGDDYDENLTVMKFAELVSEVHINRGPQSALKDLGLPSGRQQTNKLLKDLLKKMEEENMRDQEVDTNIIYRLAPAWPSLTKADGDWETFINMLETYLRRRIQHREKLQANIPGIVERVRAGIVVMERDNLFLQQETKSLRALYDNTLAENQSLNDRVFNDQITIDNLQKQLMSYNNLEDQLKKVCEERDLTRNQKQREKHRLKAELKHKLQSESEKLRKEMLSCLKEREQKLKHKTYQCQVRALQEIFDKDDVIPPTSAPVPEKDPHLGKPQPDKNNPPGTSSISRVNNPPDSQGCSLRSQAVCDQRYRQSLVDRQCSWLSHVPKQMVPIGTVLQPVLMKQKTVTKLKSTHLQEDIITNYCLTTQDQDSLGEVETKIYKGNVLPTAGGGTQVVLKDMEVLKQMDPIEVGVKKRTSDGSPKLPAEELHNQCSSGIQHPTDTLPTSPSKPKLYNSPFKRTCA